MYFSEIKVGERFLLFDNPNVIYERLPDEQNRAAVGFGKDVSTGKTKTIAKMARVISKSSTP